MRENEVQNAECGIKLLERLFVLNLNKERVYG